MVAEPGGDELAHRFIGVNTVVDKASREQRDLGHRREECLQWIQENRSRFLYWNKDIPWMALDDVAYWYGLPCFELHMTDYQTGLTEADVEAVIQKLKSMQAAKSIRCDHPLVKDETSDIHSPTDPLESEYSPACTPSGTIHLSDSISSFLS